MEQVYHLDGLDCAACAQKLEDALNRLDCLTAARVQFLTGKLTLEYDDDAEREVLRQVKKTCRRVEPDCTLTR